MSWFRIAFAAAIFARTLLLEKSAVPLDIELTVFLCTVATSVVFLRRARNGTLTRWDLSFSVLVDVGACYCALAANIYTPDEAYRGLFRMPDASVTLGIIAMSALRLSPVAVVTGVVAMLAAVRGLQNLDTRLNAVRYGSGELSMMYLLLVAMGVIGYVAARHARKLAWEGALMGSQAASARAGLELVLREHHHAKSTIAAALSASAHVERQVGSLSDDAKPEPRLADRLKELSGDLEALFEQLSSVRARALSELTAQFEAEPAPVSGVIQTVLSEVGARHEQVSLCLNLLANEARSLLLVWVCGGRAGLHRLLSNLVVNACEGDGEVGASSVQVSVALSRALGVETVELCVRDDGPGVPAGWLSGETMVSRKPFGSGLGLRLVKGVVEASGGLLLVSNLAKGASVTVLLRRAAN